MDISSRCKYMEPAGADIAAVILSAGYSSRMKSFKPLLTIGGKTAIEKLIDSVRSAGIDKIVTVTGSRRELLQPVLQKAGCAEAYNENYDSGMFSSIQAGISKARQLYPDARGYMVMPVDCPLISGETVRSVTDNADRDVSGMNFFVPVFEGKKGHPLFVPCVYADEICRHDGTGGLKAITDKYWDRMVRIPVKDEGCLLDMDTPDAYRELIEFYENGCRRRDLQELARGRRIALVRHGETVQHSEKMFIGQYDVPLNDDGRRQIRESAEKLAADFAYPEKIYASDLSRTMESAEIIRRVFCEKNNRTSVLSAADSFTQSGIFSQKESETSPAGDIRIVKEPGFREINLGKWDGQPVSRIKAEFPDEYRRRGEDIFTFKTVNRSENFYDMQYRAVKALRTILENDDSPEIIITAHSGVIRALENNLRGTRVDDEWIPLPKGGFRIING